MVDPSAAMKSGPASTSTLRADRCEHSITIFDCPIIRIDHPMKGVTHIFLGKITIHVYSGETERE